MTDIHDPNCEGCGETLGHVENGSLVLNPDYKWAPIAHPESFVWTPFQPEEQMPTLKDLCVCGHSADYLAIMDESDASSGHSSVCSCCLSKVWLAGFGERTPSISSMEFIVGNLCAPPEEVPA